MFELKESSWMYKLVDEFGRKTTLIEDMSFCQFCRRFAIALFTATGIIIAGLAAAAWLLAGVGGILGWMAACVATLSFLPWGGDEWLVAAMTLVVALIGMFAAVGVYMLITSQGPIIRSSEYVIENPEEFSMVRVWLASAKLKVCPPMKVVRE